MFKHNLIFIIVILIACCGYSTRVLLPSHLKTIAIPVVGNETIKPGLGELLTDSLTSDFTNNRILKVTSIDKANLILECKITNYEKSAQSYTSEQAVSVWKITLSAEINAKDKTKSESDSVALTKGNVSTWITYPTDSTEDYGINKAVNRLSQEILTKVLTAW